MNPESQIVLLDVYMAFTMLVLYGLYIVLFIFSIYTLTHRTPPGRLILLVATSAMFLLSTSATALAVAVAGVALQGQLNISTAKKHIPSGDLKALVALVATEDIRLAINNVVVDLLLLYRCYIIWGSNKKVVILPAILIPILLILLGTSGLESIGSLEGGGGAGC
ncbi:hypothetical protein MVEN_02559000 [Mycena venus]|uniref:Uncharacterized protein n=1 Tax=Mycena venus TaxID=2733690 RepID=A0A8H6U3F9_9AGAR|nr:hypothetical protein MVEN_02559000 [Mycena venus]